MDPKARLRQISGALAASGTLDDKGKFGELRAREWFTRMKIEFFSWPQTPETMPQKLSRRGGKRPDFATELSGELVYFDAKYHLTVDLTEFALEDEELSKFKIFREWIKDDFGDQGNRDVVFMVYPQEARGEKFVLIHLDELLQGESVLVRGKLGKRVSLKDREEIWINQHASAP